MKPQGECPAERGLKDEKIRNAQRIIDENFNHSCRSPEMWFHFDSAVL
jgi:hypothetical protein